MSNAATIYYVLRLDTQRVIGRVHAADDASALEAASSAKRWAMIAAKFGVRVEPAINPPSRLAKQLLAISARRAGRMTRGDRRTRRVSSAPKGDAARGQTSHAAALQRVPREEEGC